MATTIANADMAKAWKEEGVHWADHDAHYDDAVRHHHLRMMDAAAIASTDRVLDIGCGNGQSTRDAALRATAGSAHGVDLSPDMLERARARAGEAGLANVTFELADAQSHPFDDRAFDVAISRFGAMFFGDRTAAMANIARTLAPDGRLVWVAWRSLDENEWLTAVRGALAAGRDLPAPPAGAPGPFGLADADGVRAALRTAGFDDIDIEAVDEPFWLGSDADDACSFMRSTGVALGLLNDLDEDATAQALDALQSVMSAHETVDGVVFGSAAWLITARRP